MNLQHERSIKETIAFAQMLCTRFCHDIAGAVSAVSNGMDFFLQNDVPEIKEQAIDLLQLSSHEAFVKLQMYRLAYGRVSRGMPADMSEFREIVDGYFEHTKSSILWQDDPLNPLPDKIDPALRQILTNMLLVASSIMVYGGTLTISHHAASGQHPKLIVRAQHERIKEDYEIFGILRRDVLPDFTQLTPQNITTHFLVQLVDREGIALLFDTTKDEVCHHITLSATYNFNIL